MRNKDVAQSKEDIKYYIHLKDGFISQNKKYKIELIMSSDVYIKLRKTLGENKTIISPDGKKHNLKDFDKFTEPQLQHFLESNFKLILNEVKYYLKKFAVYIDFSKNTIIDISEMNIIMSVATDIMKTRTTLTLGIINSFPDIYLRRDLFLNWVRHEIVHILDFKSQFFTGYRLERHYYEKIIKILRNEGIAMFYQHKLEHIIEEKLFLKMNKYLRKFEAKVKYSKLDTKVKFSKRLEKQIGSQPGYIYGENLINVIVLAELLRIRNSKLINILKTKDVALINSILDGAHHSLKKHRRFIFALSDNLEKIILKYLVKLDFDIIPVFEKSCKYLLKYDILPKDFVWISVQDFKEIKKISDIILNRTFRKEQLRNLINTILRR
jgi:hypothetical protein